MFHLAAEQQGLTLNYLSTVKVLLPKAGQENLVTLNYGGKEI